uniref:7TM_GPCR_Srx domain-containing protein n=1 Tax=Heterorhabditis bacteriophora TaxID=37862 RepID=A0A1I7WHY8_HETBA
MNNAFGRLTASQSTGEAVLCSVFAFFYFPMVLIYFRIFFSVCKFISWNIDFYKDISIVCIITVVDIITITKVRLTSKQAVLQGVVFVVELFTYFLVAWKFENKWAIWSLTTLAWNLVHTTDALIIIGYNAEFRRLVTAPLKKLHRCSLCILQLIRSSVFKILNIIISNVDELDVKSDMLS